MPRTATPTFREFAQEFLTFVENDRAPGTLANYRSMISKWALPFFGDMHLSSITKKHLAQYTTMLGQKTEPVSRSHPE